MRHPEERDLALWTGGDLAPEEAAQVEAHLAACSACRALADGLQASRAGLEALGAEPVDPAALARIRDGVRRRLDQENGVGRVSAHLGAGSARHRARRWAKAHPTIWALAAALALAALGVGIWVRNAEPGEPERVARAEGPPLPESPVEVDVPSPIQGPEEAPSPPTEGTPTPDSHPETPAPPETGAAPTAPTEAPVRTASLEPQPEGPTEPMVIQVVSDDPDIVYYWLVEPEETEDEAVSS